MSEVTIFLPSNTLENTAKNGPDISGVETDGKLIDLWLSECRSPHTFRMYENISMRFLATLPHGLKRCSVADIARFEQSISHMKPNSKHTIMNVVRSLFSFARRTGFIGLSPAHARKNRKPPFSLHKRYLEPDEVWALIDFARNEKDAVFMRTLYATGVRVAEALSATWGDLQIGKNFQRLNVLGKGGRWREVSIPNWAALVRPEHSHTDDFIFSICDKRDPHPHKAMSYATARQLVLSAALRAKIGKAVTPHWFRHAFITHSQDRGMRPKDVQAQVGHSSLGTTSMYSHARDDIAPGDVLERKKE